MPVTVTSRWFDRRSATNLTNKAKKTFTYSVVLTYANFCGNPQTLKPKSPVHPKALDSKTLGLLETLKHETVKTLKSLKP